jgi:hypothetical protein
MPSWSPWHSDWSGKKSLRDAPKVIASGSRRGRLHDGIAAAGYRPDT